MIGHVKCSACQNFLDFGPGSICGCYHNIALLSVQASFPSRTYFLFDLLAIAAYHRSVRFGTPHTYSFTRASESFATQIGRRFIMTADERAAGILLVKIRQEP